MNLEVRATGLRAMRQKHGLTQRCGFEELFQVVMVNPETSQEQVLTPQHGQRRPA